MADGGDDGDLRVELVTLRARVEEQTALQKRAVDSIRRLGDSLVSGRRSFERLLSLNSFVAYGIFTVLLGGGLYLLYQSRADDLVAAEREAMAARAGAEERLEEAEAELEARREAASRAREVYDLGGEGEPGQILTAYAELSHDHLTPTEREVLGELAREARAEIAGDVGGEAIELFESGEYGDAASALAEALELVSDRRRISAFRYYEGRARLELEAYDEAARSLRLALAAGAEERGFEDARYYLGAALEGAGEGGAAARAYEAFAQDYPSSPRAYEASESARTLADP